MEMYGLPNLGFGSPFFYALFILKIRLTKHCNVAIIEVVQDGIQSRAMNLESNK